MCGFINRLAAGLSSVATVTVLSLGLAAPAAAQDTIQLRPITTAIVPTVTLSGDREFGGNGPRITVGVQLSVERGGRAIYATVSMSARELGGDGSATSVTPAPFLVWDALDEDCVQLVERIVSPAVTTFTDVSAPGCSFGCGVIGPQEDGGVLATRTNTFGGPVRTITYLGDTAGDDISTDANPSGDTSIRRIDFNPLQVAFQQPSLCG